jgi:hypothetical protein
MTTRWNPNLHFNGTKAYKQKFVQLNSGGREGRLTEKVLFLNTVKMHSLLSFLKLKSIHQHTYLSKQSQAFLLFRLKTSYLLFNVWHFKEHLLPNFQCHFSYEWSLKLEALCMTCI